MTLRSLLAASVLVLAGGAAAAATVTYQCVGYRPLTAEFTPRVGQLHFEGKDYTVRRVADAREATFVDGRHGVTVVTRQRDLSLHLPRETLACKLQSDALSPESLGVKPAAPASAPAR